jgi:hypothetical protein
MRSAAIVIASLFVATTAHAQDRAIEKCTGNFEEAQLKEKRGKLVEAEELYAACAASKCPEMIRTDCSGKRAEMLRRIPTITVVVRDASGSELTSYVEIDGKPLADRAHAWPIDPGEHTVNYRVEGRKPSSQKITVVEGEKARVITITAKDVGEEPAPAQGGAAPAAQEGPAIVGPVVLVSVGVLLLGVGVAMQIFAKREDEKRQALRAQADDPTLDEIDQITVRTAANSRGDAAERNQLIALTAGISGLLFIAGGVTWYLVTRPSAPRKASFAPLVAPGLAGASYGLRF